MNAAPISGGGTARTCGTTSSTARLGAPASQWWRRHENGHGHAPDRRHAAPTELVDGAVEEDRLDLTTVQGGQGGREGQRHHREVEVTPPRREGLQCRPRRGAHPTRTDPDPDPAPVPRVRAGARAAAGNVDEVVERPQHLAGDGEQLLTGVRDPRAAGAAVEQHDPQGPLELVDLGGQRRLAHEQPGGGPTEVQLLRERHESPHVLDPHRAPTPRP